MIKIFLTLLALLATVSTVAFASVEATGEGPSKDQALIAAMRKAVEQDLGIFIKSSTTIVDSALYDDKILSHSKGYVTSYKIIKEGRTDNGFFVIIDATVDKNTLKDDLDALAILRNSIGNPRILVAFSKRGEGARSIQNKDFINEIYNGIVESLTDKQLRVADKTDSEKLTQQTEDTRGVDEDIKSTAAYGLGVNAEYTLSYSVSGEIRESSEGKSVKLRIKTELIDNTRSQIITSKMVEQTGSGLTVNNALEMAAREGGRKVVDPMIEVIQKNWMDAQQNGQIYTIVIDGVDKPEETAAFTSMVERFPLVNGAKELETGSGKTTLEATYKGKRDQLDRDVIRAAKELGWNLQKVQADGARSVWKKQARHQLKL